jgi:hypothetical protein
MRDYRLIVPSDCVISNTVSENREALKLMKHYLRADTRPSARTRLRRCKSNKAAVGRS